GEAAALFQRHGHRGGAAEANHRFVDGKSGVGIDDLVARFQQRQHGEEDDGLAAGYDRHVLWAHLNAAGARNVRGDGFAQFGLALGGSIVSPALVERLFGGFDDLRRSWEIGLADLQGNHAATLRFQRTGAYQDVESRFDADTGHSFCKLHGGPLSWTSQLNRKHLLVGVLTRYSARTCASRAG